MKIAGGRWAAAHQGDVKMCVVRRLAVSAAALILIAGRGELALAIDAEVVVESLEEANAVLEKVALRMRANFERLRTWEGVFRFNEKVQWTHRRDAVAHENSPADPARPAAVGVNQVGEEAAWKIDGGQIRFAVDRSTAAFSCAVECDGPPEFVSRLTGLPINVPSHPFQVRVLQTTDDVIAIRPNTGAYRDAPGALPGASITELTRVATRDDPASNESARRRSFAINALDLFDSCSRKTWDNFGPQPEEVDLMNGRKERRIQDGWLRVRLTEPDQRGPSTVTVSTMFAGGSELKQRLVATWRLQEESDYLPTLYETELIDPTAGTKTARERIEWEYRSESGVLIPVHVHQQLFDNQGDLTYGRELNLLECKVNEPLTSGALDQRALGLRDGDRLQDNLSGGESVYLKGAWVPETEYVAQRQGASWAAPDRIPSRVAIVAGSILLVVTTALVVAYRLRTSDKFRIRPK